MISVAIVEDEHAEAEALMAYITRIGNESGEHFSVDVYSDSLAFPDGYKHTHDAIFMDIEMPCLNGMDAARRPRKLNEEVQKRGADKLVRTNGGVVQVKLGPVYYVEGMGRDTIYHTEAENVCTQGKLKDLEEEFAPYGFVRCSNCCMVF